ncbi:protein kinase domain-containing protein [Pseudarthrobacter sulfonivorans]|uniref:protein kinase domain-containing protein n=1 Tax=Pseudarthrobacter sulfonivorans TaxID=121292 RepID=UPI0021043EBF|nr:protein kinase [Pseudarthrobacter sulfonivorans]
MDHFTAPELPGFLVGRMLGRGGSSTVWLVTEERTGREFALKCLGREPGAGEDDVRREIRILSVLDHQHLIKAHDAIRFAAPWDEAAEAVGCGIGLLLDYAPGGSLADLVGSRRKLPVGETVTVLTPIAQVLGYLHAKGFTHGDVSPGNVLFTGHGKPMLADVGIARMVGDVSAVADQGTEGFTDPSPVDAVRAGLQPERDVYSVAALGWYCLTGEPPRRSADRPPLPLLLPDVPLELTAALEAGLNEDRRQRPTAVELATAIYRSAPPLPIDLASSVHATVIPQLLTRRRIPERPDGAVRNGLRAWYRKLSTSRWSGLIGVRQALPFPADEEQPGPHPQPADASLPARLLLSPEEEQSSPRGKHAGQSAAKRRPPDNSPEPTALEPTAPQPTARRRSGPAGRGRRVPKTVRRRGTVLLAAGAAAMVAGAIWTAGAFGPGGPFAALAGVEEQGTGSDSARAVPKGFDQGSDVPALEGAGNSGIPAAIAARLGSTDPAEAVHGLAAVRAMAFSSGRLELLDLVNAPGSAAAATDARLKDELQGTGRLLAGFTSTVADVQVQPGSPAGQAIVGVTSETSPYVEQDSSGAVVAAGGAGTKQALRLVLVALDGQWRLADVLPGS